MYEDHYDFTDAEFMHNDFSDEENGYDGIELDDDDLVQDARANRNRIANSL